MDRQLEFLEDIVQRSLREKVWGGLAGGLLSAPVLFLMGRMQDAPDWLILLLCGGVFAYCLSITAEGLRDRPHAQRLLDALRHDPDQVVWIYEHQMSHAYVDLTLVRGLRIGLEDGKILRLWPPKARFEEAFEAFVELAPGATVGYSEEAATAFKEDPRSLYLPQVVLDPALGDPTALELCDRLEAGDWRPAHLFLQSLRDWSQRDFYIEVFRNWDGRPDWVERWWEAHPDSAVANLMRGAHSVHWAWEARGYDYGDSVEDEGARLFFERLRGAEADLRRAAELDPADPTPWSLLLRCCRGLEQGQKQAEQLYTELLARDPLHRSGHSQMLQTVAPKWGGSRERMWAVARSASQRAPEGHGLHALLVEAHLEASFEEEGYFSRAEVREDVMAAYKRSLGSPRHQETLHTAHDRNLFACALWLCGFAEEAGGELEVLGDRITRVPWGYFGDPVAVFREAAAGM